MTPADRNVADSEVRLMATAKLKLSVLLVGENDVHHARGVLFEGQALQPQELPLILWQLHINQSIPLSVRLEHIRVRLFANLALELLPGVRDMV